MEHIKQQIEKYFKGEITKEELKSFVELPENKELLDKEWKEECSREALSNINNPDL